MAEKNIEKGLEAGEIPYQVINDYLNERGNDVSASALRAYCRNLPVDKNDDAQFNVVVKDFVHMDSWSALPAVEPNSLSQFAAHLKAPLHPYSHRIILLNRLNEKPIHKSKLHAVQGNQKCASMTVRAACLLGRLWKLDSSAVLGLLNPPGSAIKLGSFHMTNGPDQFNRPGVWELAYPMLFRPLSFAVTGQPSPFQSDFATFTSRPHARPPSSNPFTFLEGRKSDGDGDGGGINDEGGPLPRRSIVLCITGDEMASLKLLLASLLPHPVPQQSIYDPLFTASFVMTGIERCALRNIELISTHLEGMRYVSRSSPSYQKLNHVLHLQDHLQDIMRRTKPPAIDEIKTEESLIGKHNAGELSAEVLAWANSHITLMSQTHDIAKEAHEESKAIYAMIQDQVAGKDSARNRLFAVLAAIYLPFTLASGILGMNIRQFSTYDDPKDPKNTFDPKAPSWKVLIYIGLPLTVITIALPLSFDRLRGIIQSFATKRPRTFKAVLWAGLFLLVATVIVVILVTTITRN